MIVDKPIMFALYMPFLTWKVDRSPLCFLQRDIDDFERKQNAAKVI